MSKAKEAALKAYPEKMGMFYEPDIHYKADLNKAARIKYIEGYKQAEKDILAIVKEYLEKGLRCMELSDKFQMHTFWDGFHNCAENILRELEDEK